VVADVEGAAAHAVVASVKLHNKQRSAAACVCTRCRRPSSRCDRRFEEREDEIAKLSNSVLDMNFILARLLKQDEAAL
jgi:hypothetical protein